MVNGIVKMIPKLVDVLEFLDNWRSLTMLTTMYKIISKILVEWIKPVVPQLMGLWKIGFVKD